MGLEGTESFSKAREWGLEPLGVNLNTANPAALAGVAVTLRRVARAFKPHIVNCHRGESFFLWAAINALAGKDGFGLVRTRGDQRPPKASKSNIFLHANLADAVIATSSSIAAALRDKLHVPSDRLYAVLGGVDTRRFFSDPEGREAMRSAWGVCPDETVVGLVGRFDDVKGQKELIRAFARLRESLGGAAGRFRLALAGFGTSAVSEERVWGWVNESGIAEHVVFPGKCENVRALINALDLGVVASLGSETIARVALEIMACGVPLVGTRVGVMPDLLTEEALATPGDVGGLAALLLRFADEPAFGDALRAAQADRMRSLGDRDFCAQTLAVYRKVLYRRAAAH